MTCAMRLVARMADDMGINIQVGRYSTVSINLSNILGVLFSSRRKIVPSCIPTIDDERVL